VVTLVETFALRWFSLCYLTLGVLLVTAGIYLLIRLNQFIVYIKGAVTLDNPPVTWIQSVRYLLLFTIPGLILSFFPFSWVELLFSLWCLVIVFTAGQFLLHWNQTAEAIRQNEERLPVRLRFIAANLISLGLIMFLLYFNLQSSFG